MATDSAGPDGPGVGAWLRVAAVAAILDAASALTAWATWRDRVVLVGVMIAFVVMIFATVLTLKGALMLFGAAGALFAIGATLFGILLAATPAWFAFSAKGWGGFVTAFALAPLVLLLLPAATDWPGFCARQD